MHDVFVLDASLLEKYSSNIPNSSNEVDDIFVQVANKYNSKHVYTELTSFIGILEEVVLKNAKICHNEEIIKEYYKYKDKIPSQLLFFYETILSDTACLEEKKNGNFLNEDFLEIANTILQYKVTYLDLASALEFRIVVSTLEDKNNIYFSVSDFEIKKHRISCKCTWEYLEHLKKRTPKC